MGGILGLTFKAPEEAPLDAEPFKKMAMSIMEKAKAANIAGVFPNAIPDSAESIIAALIDARKDLRKSKQFQLADDIRKGLAGLGIGLEDTPSGTIWKRN